MINASSANQRDRQRQVATAMGMIRTAFELANPATRSLSPVTAEALVDTGAVHLRLPEHLAIQLDLKELEMSSA
jgi:hypothetical protein